jgi:hypothetical protein
MAVLFSAFVSLAMILLGIAMRRTSVSESTLGLNGGNLVIKPRKGSQKARSPYRATSIVHHENACNAVKAISGTRFLDVDKITPALPVPQCDAAHCNCEYARHEDRRECYEDRRMPASLQSDLYDKNGNSQRRTRKRGRRKEDWA